MSKVLVFGAAGMLGRCVIRDLSRIHDVEGTVRRGEDASMGLHVHVVDLRDSSAATRILDRVQPRVVVNCAGIIKQRVRESTPQDVFLVNTLLPHQVALWSEQHGARFVHISTDCVFRGDREGPPYREETPPDADDLYGYSKAAGEVLFMPSTITLRTSIIGLERGGSHFGLLEWFLSHPDGVTVPGYANHWWSGVTTAELSTLICRLSRETTWRPGLYQVAGDPISKYELLRLVSRVFDRALHVTPVEAESAVYRILDGSRLMASFDHRPSDLTNQLELLCSLKNMS